MEYNSNYTYRIDTRDLAIAFRVKTELDDVNIAELLKDVKWAIDEYLKSESTSMESWVFLLGHVIRLGIEVLHLSHNPENGPFQSYSTTQYWGRYPIIPLNWTTDTQKA